MTLKTKNSRQVSLDFKKIPLDVSNPIENRKLNSSLGEDEETDEDCKIYAEEKSKSKNIKKFFLPLPKTPGSILKRKNQNETGAPDSSPKCSKKVRYSLPEASCEKMEVEEVRSEGEKENTVKETQERMEISSDEPTASEEEEEEESEKSESSDSEIEVISGEGSEVPAGKAEEKSDTKDVKSDEQVVKKKRRPSSVVQAERVEKELQRARRRMENEAQRLARQAQKEQLLQEKKEKKEKMLAERNAARLQAEREKEERRLKKEEAKREKDQAKKEEREKKEEERKRREEEKVQAEKERREREENKKLEQEREAEEERRRRSRQAAFFSNFFVKSLSAENLPAQANEERTKSSKIEDGPFRQFQVKKDMELAPISHHVPEARSEMSKRLDRIVAGSPDPNAVLYLAELKTGARKPIRVRSKRESRINDPDVEVIDPVSHQRQWHRAKLLQFAEDVRPPYYGTFRQHSHKISARRPFSKDLALRNYEVDSEEEWEEEETGESLSDSENDDEEAVADDQDDENDGFFVPHGYLSEDEGVDGEEEDLTPEMRKAKQQLLQQRFEAAMQRKIQPLQNVLITPAVDPAQHPLLKLFKVIKLTNDFPIPTTALSATTSISGNKVVSKYGVPDEAMHDLVRLITGNSLSLKKLLFEFRMFWELKMTGRLPSVTLEEDLKGRDWKEFSISKTKLERKIREVAKKEDGCWRVSPEVLERFPCETQGPWEYVTSVTAHRKKRKSSPARPETAETGPVPEEKPTVVDKPESEKKKETPSNAKRASIMNFFATPKPTSTKSPTDVTKPLISSQNKTPGKSPSSNTKSSPGPLKKTTVSKSPSTIAKSLSLKMKEIDVADSGKNRATLGLKIKKPGASSAVNGKTPVLKNKNPAASELAPRSMKTPVLKTKKPATSKKTPTLKTGTTKTTNVKGKATVKKKGISGATHASTSSVKTNLIVNVSEQSEEVIDLCDESS